ncbi:MAG: hypothetical protein AAF203_02420, partial [Pseudomonadota bacterium]
MKSRFIILPLLLIQFFLGCTSIKDREDHKPFTDLTHKFLDDYWQVHPSFASHVGLSGFDGIMEIPSPQNFEKKLVFYKRYLQLFNEVSDDDLSLNQMTDKKLIVNDLASSIWTIETF